jgi:hypothetical protein
VICQISVSNFNPFPIVLLEILTCMQKLNHSVMPTQTPYQKAFQIWHCRAKNSVSYLGQEGPNIEVKHTFEHWFFTNQMR